MIYINNFNYVGTKKRKNYFEGWYFRIVDNNCYSFIFGLSLNEEDSHSFIQIIDQTQKKVYYFRFKVSDFHYDNNMIKIENNFISANRLRILTKPFDIDVNITPNLFLKKRILNGGVMGPFKYFYFPTRHEIIFMNAKLNGYVKNKNKKLKIDGNGYMEKDLGTRFPKKWLWLQTNSFQNSNISITISKADLIGKISGFFCFLNIEGKEYRFATYDGSKISNYRNGNNVEIIIKRGKYILKVEVKLEPGHLIIAPVKKAKMERKIEESLTSSLTLCLYKNNKLIFSDTGINVGIEYLY